MQTDKRNVQAFPSGKCYRVSGQGGDLDPYVIHAAPPEGPGIQDVACDPRPATNEEAAGIEAQERAEGYVDRGVLCCDSVLIGDLLDKESDMDGFGCEDIENLHEDTSKWNLDQCREYIEEYGGDAGRVPVIDEWREAAQEIANENPHEVYEWWRVNGWLCGQLRDIGQPVLDNDYGCWWGRTCTGQSMIQDGTLQQIAAKFNR